MKLLEMVQVWNVLLYHLYQINYPGKDQMFNAGMLVGAVFAPS